MTKRDVADIVLVFLGIKFIIGVFQSFASIVVMLMPLPHSETILPAAISALYICLSVICGWAFLFKRDILLDVLFPGSAASSIELGAEAGALANYSFWIKIFGIFISLASGVSFLSRSIIGLAIARDALAATWWYDTGAECITTALALLLVWNAEKVALLFQRTKPPST